MVLLIAAFVLSVGLTIALIRSVDASRGSRRPGSGLASTQSDRLPIGADAALWSIVEAVPDPRNHLALTRDLTGEVRIAGTLLDPEFRASTVSPPPRPVLAGGSSVRIIPAPTAAAIEAIDAEHAEREAQRAARRARRAERAS